MVDIEALKQPVSDDSAVGPNMRDEPDFRDIEDMPGQFANMKPPELRKVVENCVEWLARTKDQALVLVAIKAAARMNDLASVKELLGLLKDFIDSHWDDYHPGPAEETAEARIVELNTLTVPAALILPLQRMALAKFMLPGGLALTAAVLSQACAPTKAWDSDDDEKLAAQLESGQTTQAAAKAYRQQREGGRALRGFMRVLSDEARAADEASGIEPVELEVPGDQLAALALRIRGEVAETRQLIGDLSDLIYDLVDSIGNKGADTPNLGPVLSQLKTMTSACDDFMSAFPLPADPEAVAEAGDISEGGPVTGTNPARPQGFVVTKPRNRDDVLTALDAITAFYVENEPSSPVPLMLKRLRVWVRMDFLQLMEEIAPGGVEDARRLLAITED